VQTVIQPNSGRPYATYEIDQLEQGAWYPRTWGPGYSSRGYGPGSCNVFIHPAVTLATGQEAKNDFNLACPGTNTAWYPITGTLRNYSGTPIVGVQVNSDRTDINGNFVAVSQYLNAGKAILVFNRQPKWSLYQDSYVYTPVGTAGQVTSGVNLLLPGCAMIRFSAAMADGGPPSVSVDVKYIPVGRSWEDSYSLRPTHNAHAYCGISKTYSLSLASSRYYETVDFLSVLSGEYELSPLSVTLSPTELQQGTHINVPVTVTPRHWGVFGTARRGGEPIATGVIVAAMTASLPAGAPPPSPQSQAYYGAVTGADGAYELRLPDGTFNLYAWETRLVNGAAVTTRKDGSVVVSHNKQERSFDW
jgi:hypothetical protein